MLGSLKYNSGQNENIATTLLIHGNTPFETTNTNVVSLLLNGDDFATTPGEANAVGMLLQVDGQAYLPNNVALLLNGNGTNGSKTIVDSSLFPSTVIANGNAQLNTSIKKYGSASIKFDGTTGTNLTISNHKLNFSRNDWTIETWFLDSIFNNNIIELINCNLFDGISINLNNSTRDLVVSVTGRVPSSNFPFYERRTTTLTPNFFTSPNTWYHLAVVRFGNTLTVYINGQSFASATVNFDTVEFNGAALVIGNKLNGYMDDIRIINNKALYTSNFTPPLSELVMPVDNFDKALVPNSITSYGNAFIDSNIKKNGTGSFSFDGKEDYLEIANSDKINFGTSDFTIEFWANFKVLQYRHPILSHYINLDRGWSVIMQDSTVLLQLWNNNDYPSNWGVGATIPNIDTWYHIAFTRNKNVIKCFVNGQLQSINYWDDSGQLFNVTDPDATLRIGKTVDVPTQPDEFGGYLDDIRIIKGAAIYNTSFTPPSQKLSLDFVIPSRSISDNSLIKNTINNVGCGTDSSIKKFGNSSIKFEAGTYLEIMNGYKYNFEDKNFTIEAWINFDRVTGQEHLFNNYFRYYVATNVVAQSGWMIQMINSPSVALKVSLFQGQTATEELITPWTPQANTWYHLAVVRNGNTLTVYINGQSIGSKQTTSNIINCQKSLLIGTAESVQTVNNYFNGYMDDIRITKSMAVYTDQFTPPIQPLSIINATYPKLSVVDSSIYENIITPYGNVQIDTNVKKFGNSSIKFNGNYNDYIEVYESDNFDFYRDDFTIEFWIKLSQLPTITGNLLSYRNPDSIGVSRADRGWDLDIFINSTNAGFDLSIGSFGINGISFLSANVDLVNQWNHIAIVREEKTYRGFINGNLIKSQTYPANPNVDEIREINSNIIIPTFSAFTIGRNLASTNLDDIRITKGIARYQASFTPPTEPFPDP